MKLSKSIFAAMLFFGIINTASAQIQVTPMRLEMPVDKQAVTVTLRNTGDTAQDLDIRVFGWVSGSVTDETPTTDIVSSKPVVTIPAGATKLIRFLVKTRKETAVGFYRVAIRDITPAPKAAVGETSVHVAITQTLPLVVINKPGAAGRLVIDGGELRNTGNKQVRITAIGGVKTLAYLLPSESRPACMASKEGEKCSPIDSLDAVVWSDTSY